MNIEKFRPLSASASGLSQEHEETADVMIALWFLGVFCGIAPIEIVGIALSLDMVRAGVFNSEKKGVIIFLSIVELASYVALILCCSLFFYDWGWVSILGWFVGGWAFGLPRAIIVGKAKNYIGPNYHPKETRASSGGGGGGGGGDDCCGDCCKCGNCGCGNCAHCGNCGNCNCNCNGCCC